MPRTYKGVSVVVVRFVNDLQLRPGFKIELLVCVIGLLFGTIASIDFTRKGYIPENTIVWLLGLAPSVALFLETVYADQSSTCLPLFSGSGRGRVSAWIGSGRRRLDAAACAGGWNGIKERLNNRRSKRACDIETGDGVCAMVDGTQDHSVGATTTVASVIVAN